MGLNWSHFTLSQSLKKIDHLLSQPLASYTPHTTQLKINHHHSNGKLYHPLPYPYFLRHASFSFPTRLLMLTWVCGFINLGLWWWGQNEREEKLINDWNKYTQIQTGAWLHSSKFFQGLNIWLLKPRSFFGGSKGAYSKFVKVWSRRQEDWGHTWAYVSLLHNRLHNQSDAWVGRKKIDLPWSQFGVEFCVCLWRCHTHIWQRDWLSQLIKGTLAFFLLFFFLNRRGLLCLEIAAQMVKGGQEEFQDWTAMTKNEGVQRDEMLTRKIPLAGARLRDCWMALWRFFLLDGHQQPN